MKKMKSRAGVTAGVLQALAALVEDPGLIPRTYIETSVISDYLEPSSSHHGHQSHTWCTCIYTQIKALIHTK